MISKIDKLLDDLVKLHPKYIDLSLDRLLKLLEKLGNPHLNLPTTIHIAGTNGKGSILSFIRTILIANGYSCDSYSSPHLTKFNERIFLRNKNVSTKKLFETLLFVKKINNANPITFFEITTAAAFVLFQKSKSDFLVLETGLGGRLDATNVIPKKLCSIITPISYDHEEFLGNKIEQITKEKLGIVRNSNFTLISRQKKQVMNYVKKKLKNTKDVYFYGKDYKVTKEINDKFEVEFIKKNELINKPNLNGKHQLENASVAIAFSKIMVEKKLKLNFKKINFAIKNNLWPGRLEVIKYYNKIIILDGSHNIEGAHKLKDYLTNNKIKPILLFGMLNNKKMDIFLKIIKTQIIKLFAIKIPQEENAFETNQIAKSCKSLSIHCNEINNINQFIKIIKNTEEKIFLVTGSLYLIGKIRNRFYK